MNKMILFLGLFIAGYTLSYGQDNYQESFFHDLTGTEGSNGVTQLFYKHYVEPDDDCIIWRNDVFQYNTGTNIDSLRFEAIHQVQCREFDSPIDVVEDVAFMDGDLDQWFIVQNRLGPYSNNMGYILAHNDSFFHSGWHWADKIELFQSDTLEYGVFNFTEASVIVLLDEGELPSEEYNYPMLVKAGSSTFDDEEYCDSISDDTCFLGISDSVMVNEYNFLSIDQNRNGALYYQRGDSLFWSAAPGDSIEFLNNDYQWSQFRQFFYDSSSQRVFAATCNKFRPLGDYKSPETYRLLNSADGGNNWELLLQDETKLYVSEIFENGQFYYAKDHTIYHADEFGNSITNLTEVEDAVTGLYKKPGSDLLYVLTINELLEVNTATLETKSLRQLPVSNEPKPGEIPVHAELHQNYPNPFNPVTVIGYQLPVSSEVTIKVFDLLGREVATLVDGRQSAGVHLAEFDASNLASGVYIYRITAGDFVQSRQMVLVK